MLRFVFYADNMAQYYDLYFIMYHFILKSSGQTDDVYKLFKSVINATVEYVLLLCLNDISRIMRGDPACNNRLGSYNDKGLFN